MFFVLWATRLPTQVARTHTTGNLKVQQRSLGTHTHTHKTNTHTDLNGTEKLNKSYVVSKIGNSYLNGDSGFKKLNRTIIV